MIPAAGERATVRSLLEWGARELQAAKIPEARFDAELLLAGTLGRDRAHLRAHVDAEVDEQRAQSFRAWIRERARGCPAAYLLGEREFYGLKLRVNSSVLVPRPETELLVEWALEWIASFRRLRGESRPLRIADLGTGSGCIVLALAAQCRTKGWTAEFFAVDCSAAALEVARANAALLSLGEEVRFLQGDLLQPLAAPLDLVVSNPPYVAVDDPRLDPGCARFEPEIALRDTLDGDGFGYYRRLAREAPPLLAAGGALLVEVAEDGAAEVRDIFARAGFAGVTRRDLAGIERAILLERAHAAGPG